MIDPVDALAWLQHADSFFPSGAVSFSWGLESLAEEGTITDVSEVEAYVLSQLDGRWATIDRPATIAAYRSAADLDRVAMIDSLVDAQTLARELRDGSKRMGGALLALHRRLATPSAEAYARRVQGGTATGHIAVVQGLVWRGVGLSENAVDATSGHQLCTALLGAALRLGLIGHVDAQKILTASRSVRAAILATEPPDIEDMRTFTPEAEIATMRHETQRSRLFAN
jgi:urease accessory protein